MYVYNMIRDAVDINDFIIITEVADVKETILDSCKFEEPVVAVASMVQEMSISPSSMAIRFKIIIIPMVLHFHFMQMVRLNSNIQ